MLGSMKQATRTGSSRSGGSKAACVRQALALDAVLGGALSRGGLLFYIAVERYDRTTESPYNFSRRECDAQLSSVRKAADNPKAWEEMVLAERDKVVAILTGGTDEVIEGWKLRFFNETDANGAPIEGVPIDPEKKSDTVFTIDRFQLDEEEVKANIRFMRDNLVEGITADNIPPAREHLIAD